MRLLYSLIFTLACPFILLRLYWRSRQHPAYRERISERLGSGSQRKDAPLWIHAVSVGETVAIAPLVKRLLQQQPALPILVTTMTPTGARQVTALFGDAVEHRYCPYDQPWLLQRFLKRVKPRGLIIVETELWPNMINQCHRQQIPVLIANARLSARSAKGYQRFKQLSAAMLKQINCLAAQDKTTAERFTDLGLPETALTCTGSIKFDTNLPVGTDLFSQQLKQQWGPQRPVWVAGSTHDGEDEIILQCFSLLRQQYPQLLLVLVPRHPERFNQVTEQAKQLQFNTINRASGLTPDQNTAVYIGDTMGELVKLYACADICFVGGSLIANGGHNPLEPAALGKPVIMGSEVFNFQEICQQLSQSGGLTLVENSDALLASCQRLLADHQLREQQGQSAQNFVNANKGALDKLYQLVCKEVPGLL